MQSSFCVACLIQSLCIAVVNCSFPCWWGVSFKNLSSPFFFFLFPLPARSLFFILPEVRFPVAFSQRAHKDRNPIAPRQRKQGEQTWGQDRPEVHIPREMLWRRQTLPQAPHQIHIKTQAQRASQGQNLCKQGILLVGQPYRI